MEFTSDSAKVGVMLITFETMTDRELMHALMELCTVLHIEPHESGRGNRFVVVSELFQDLRSQEEIPEYRVEFRTTGIPFENPEFEAKRLNSAGFGFVAIRQNVIRVPAIAMSYAANTPH